MSSQCGRNRERESDKERERDIVFTKEYIPPNVMDGAVGYTNTAATHIARTQLVLHCHK